MGRLLAEGGSAASGWVCPTTSLKMDGFNWETLQCTQGSGGFSRADVAGDDPQPCSGVGFVGEVAWALLGKRIVLVFFFSGFKVLMHTNLKGFHTL